MTKNSDSHEITTHTIDGQISFKILSFLCLVNTVRVGCQYCCLQVYLRTQSLYMLLAVRLLWNYCVSPPLKNKTPREERQGQSLATLLSLVKHITTLS